MLQRNCGGRTKGGPYNNKGKDPQDSSLVLDLLLLLIGLSLYFSEEDLYIIIVIRIRN